MAQGYPQPQPQQYGQHPDPYGQNPYGQGAHGQNPYGQNPYGQGAHGQNPYGQDPYGQGAHGRNPQAQPYPGQPQYQQPQPPQAPYPPYQQAPHQQPYGQPQPAAHRPPCPKEAGGGRRFLAIVLDFLFAVGLGFVAANAASRPRPAAHAVAGHASHAAGPAVPYFVAQLLVGLAASFLNQVVLARLTGFSVGKGILAMRVVRRKGVMRPNTWRLTRRWLLGFVFLAVTLLSEDFDLDDGDIVGMRSVRWKHLQEYQQAVGRLG
ncbi:RDD family protein [Kitasatospora sp. NPDC048538]|uniref:RDD family protein n=1 Tax=unclassified Kitasatospora TaxID=2633591 RepID=UPI00340F38C1